MEADTTPAVEQTEPAEQARMRDEHGRFAPQQQEVEQAAQDAEEAPPPPKTPRKLKVANDEFDVPDELPEEVYQRVSKTAGDLHGAWTRKMQEVAEARRQAEQEAQQRAADWQASQANLDLMAEERALSKHVKDYEGVNWVALAQQDAGQYTQHWANYQMLQQQLQAKRGEIESKKSEYTAKQREAFQRAAYEMNRALSDQSTGIPGWNESLHRQLVEYGLTYGYRPEEISSTMDPRSFRILHKAYMADQAMKAAKAAESVQTPKPVSKVGGTAAAGRVDPDKMPTEEWLKWRKAELAKKA